MLRQRLFSSASIPDDLIPRCVWDESRRSLVPYYESVVGDFETPDLSPFTPPKFRSDLNLTLFY